MTLLMKRSSKNMFPLTPRPLLAVLAICNEFGGLKQPIKCGNESGAGEVNAAAVGRDFRTALSERFNLLYFGPFWTSSTYNPVSMCVQVTSGWHVRPFSIYAELCRIGYLGYGCNAIGYVWSHIGPLHLSANILRA